MSTLIDTSARRLFLGALEAMKSGSLRLEHAGQVQVFGDGAPAATLVVHRDRLFRRAIASGSIGIGEAYMDGDWSTPDLVGLVTVMLRNADVLDAASGPFAWLANAAGNIARMTRRNSRAGSRRNIHRHYDLGNDLFSLFLDRNLLYSCAYYERPDDSLELAQVQKLDRICLKLGLKPGDRVAEIGSGWGGFAVWAATRYGCHVTTTTISRQQYEHAKGWVASLGSAADRIDVRLEDYRDFTGQYDKLVSIEMFEAVGLAHYDEFFKTCDRVLKPGGQMLLQTITTDDWRFDAYRAAPDWIERYIFPGSELASVQAILTSVKNHTRLGLSHAENIGVHYALTLRAWRARFLSRLDEVRALGYDDRFIRMWDLYLAYCEAAFAERHIGNVQLVMTKTGVRGGLFDDPATTPDRLHEPARLAATVH
ncbi:MAG: cyclopropane-fatty-acyl-phospholipid synthase family protein [Vicinamibacterales bacterium]